MRQTKKKVYILCYHNIAHLFSSSSYRQIGSHPIFLFDNHINDLVIICHESSLSNAEITDRYLKTSP